MRIVGRVVLLLTLAWLTPHVAQADEIAMGDTLVIQQIFPEGNTGAGPFIATVNGDSASAFVTFCMQADVGSWSDLGAPLSVVGVTDFASSVSPSEGGDASGQNYLSSQTAWLYTQFREGSLAGYDQSVNSADALQWAIWQLEDEKSIPVGEGYSDLANSFVALADQAVANGFSGIGDVRVVNLVTAAGQDAQDQLTLLPEPSSFELLALGSFALLIFSRVPTLRRARVVA
jgi:hypothetical protein